MKTVVQLDDSLRDLEVEYCRLPRASEVKLIKVYEFSDLPATIGVPLALKDAGGVRELITRVSSKAFLVMLIIIASEEPIQAIKLLRAAMPDWGLLSCKEFVERLPK